MGGGSTLPSGGVGVVESCVMKVMEALQGPNTSVGAGADGEEDADADESSVDSEHVLLRSS